MSAGPASHPHSPHAEPLPVVAAFRVQVWNDEYSPPLTPREHVDAFHLDAVKATPGADGLAVGAADAVSLPPLAPLLPPHPLLRDFDLICVLGKGAYGKVFLVQHRHDPDRVYAMKVLRKDMVIDKAQVRDLAAKAWV